MALTKTKIDEYIGSLNQDYLDFEYDLTVINEPFNNILVGKYQKEDDDISTQKDDEHKK